MIGCELVLAKRGLAKIGLVICGLCVVATTVAEPRMHTELVTRLGYGYSSFAETHNATSLELMPRLQLTLTEKYEVTVAARLRGDTNDQYLPGRPDLSNYAGLARPEHVGEHGLAELRDAFLTVFLDQGLLRLGKQQIVWGTLDGVKVLDQLNPQSFEHFILEPFDQSRIGLLSAYLDLTTAAGRFELALIPDASTHFVPGPGAYFELTAPRYRFGQSGSNSSVPVQSGGVQDRRGTAGVRWSRYAGGMDIQVVALSGLDFEPLGRLTENDGQPTLETFHTRRELYGLGVESSFATFALRGEISYSPNRLFNTVSGQSLADTRREHWRAGVGLDWNAPLGIFANVQYLRDHVAGTEAGLTRPATEQLYTAFLRRQFLYDTLDVELRWYRSGQEQDRLFRVLVGYEISDSTRLEFALDDFKGDAQGIFGQFDQRDQVTLTLQHAF